MKFIFFIWNREMNLKTCSMKNMSKEQDNFIEKLKHSSPEEIISSAYERLCEMIFLCF